MGTRWLFIASALLLDGLAGLVGGILPERWLSRFRPPLIGFAVGALLGAAFLDLLPESAAQVGRGAFGWALASFLLLAAFERGLGGGGPGRESSLVVALLGADALHNVSDGAAIAAAFLVSPRLGVVTSLAVVVHELPEELGDFVLVRSAGMARSRALLALAAVQLTAVVGAVAVLVASALFAKAETVMLAVAAGSFVYIGATDLLPELVRGPAPAGKQGWLVLLGLVLGVTAVEWTGRLAG